MSKFKILRFIYSKPLLSRCFNEWLYIVSARQKVEIRHYHNDIFQTKHTVFVHKRWVKK